MYTVYLADTPNGQKISIAPEELGLSYQSLQWLFLRVGSIGPMLGQLWWFRYASAAPDRPVREPLSAMRLAGAACVLAGKSGLKMGA